MTHLVLLDGENNRFKRIYKGIMGRVRVGRGTYCDVDLLNSRVVGNGNVPGPDCHDSTFIVFRNKIRSKLSVPFVRAACLRSGATVFIVRCRDKLEGANFWRQIMATAHLVLRTFS